ncbi:MAG: hypothetical protein ACOH2H_06855 [Cypionkella sp.]
MFVNEDTSKAVASSAPLAQVEFNQAAMAREYHDRKFTAIFTGHHPLDGHQQVRADAADILEWLTAAEHLNAHACVFKLWEPPSSAS